MGALPLLCTTRAETAQATHMQTYYPPPQQQQQQQQQYAYPPQQQYQGGMAVGTPAMASNQAASGSGGGSSGQPEYTRYQVTPGAYQGKPSGPQQPSAPTKG